MKRIIFTNNGHGSNSNSNGNMNDSSYNNIRAKFRDTIIKQDKIHNQNNIVNLYDNHIANLQFINKLYLGENFVEKKFLVSELKSKLSSYKQQDIKKDLHEQHNLITIDDVIEKLTISKLRCFYCNKNMLLLYSRVRDPDQWTLDRLNNYNEHTCTNTIVCCLGCNLERRRKNSEKFKFTKQLQSNQIRVVKSNAV